MSFVTLVLVILVLHKKFSIALTPYLEWTPCDPVRPEKCVSRHGLFPFPCVPNAVMMAPCALKFNKKIAMHHVLT